MQFTISGQPVEATFELRTSLLDLLRDHLGLTGSKKGCNQGACGACTVLVDGQRINSCLALAVQYQGRSITTVEGLNAPGELCSAIGMAAEAKRGVPSALTEDLLLEDMDLSFDEVRERMSGNLGRCGAYNGIVEAVRETFAEEVAR